MREREKIKRHRVDKKPMQGGGCKERKREEGYEREKRQRGIERK